MIGKQISHNALDIRNNALTRKHGKDWWFPFLARFVSVLLIVIAVSPLYLGNFPAAATHVSPQFVDGNPPCNNPANDNADLDGTGQTWSELRVNADETDDFSTTNTYTDGTLRVTITITSRSSGATQEALSFDWSSNIGVDAVFVKAGSGGNLYQYDPPLEATSDSGLVGPDTKGISHILFCYDVEVLPDLTISKSASKATVQPGEAFNFFVTVTNAGAGTATTVSVFDDLDDRLTGVAATFDNNPGSPGGTGPCTVGGGNTVTCSVGSLEPSSESNQADTAVVTISAIAPADACDQITNTASTSAGNAETSTSNNTSSPVTVVDIVCANVTILKTAETTTVEAGDVATFTILVTNTSSVTATSVTVSDTLPGNIPWDTDTPGCDVAGGNLLTCNFGDLGPNATRSVTVSGTTSGDDCGIQNNTAFVSATNEPAINNTDNSSSASFEVICGLIDILKTADDDSVNAGDTIGFTIDVSNTGTGTARDVLVTDTLPQGMDWAESPDNPQCDIDDNTEVLTCNFGNMGPGSSNTVHVIATTTAQQCGVVTNTAEVGTSNDGTDSSTATITVNCPDVVVDKEGNGPISAGDTAEFTIQVTNPGPGDAFDVMLTDTLPAGVTWTTSSVTGGGSCTLVNGLLTCSFGTVTAGTTRTVVVTGETDSADCAGLTNTVTVSASNERATDTANNTDTAFIEVQCPNVTISKVGNGPLSAGDVASFTIVVTNTTGTAYDVTLFDLLPVGVSWTISDAPPGACQITVLGVLTCDFGTMTVGETRTVSVTGVTSADDCPEIINTASVTASNEAPADTTDNSASATIVVNCSDVTVSKSGNGTINAGDTAVFTFVVTSTGPGDAYDVLVTDTLPSDVTWTLTSVSGGGSCLINSNLLTCDFDTMTVGSTRTVVVSGKVAANDCGTMTNTVTTSASNEDPLKTNDNTASASITVLCADIQISKAPDQPVVNAGDRIGFTIIVSNNGPGDAYDVEVTDTLPTNAGVSWTVDGGTGASDCDIAGGVLTCNFETMTSGSSETVHISSDTTPETCGDVVNTAAVGTSNDGSDNSSATITVNCPDVVVQKDGNGTINAGDTAVFSILVSNQGTGTAFDVLVTDTLPSGVSWTITGGTGAGDCVVNGSLLTCEFETMTSGATRTVEVSGQTDAADCGVLNNTVTVSASNEAANATGNNTDTASITVQCPDVTISKDGNGPLSAGDVASFTIVVTNTTGTAYDVTLFDMLPVGVSWTISDAPPGACQITVLGVLSCDFGTMTVGETRTVSVTGTTSSDDCPALGNTASVTASNEAPAATGNNSAFDAIVVNCPDVVVQKDGNGTVNAGDTAVFSILVSNQGTGTAFDVLVTDTLPSGVSWTITGGTGAGDCVINGSLLTCDFETMTSGATRTVEVSGQTDGGDCAGLNNTATVGASNETDLSNNQDDARIAVLCASIAILKTADSPSIDAGDQIGFSIVVSNTGSGSAYDVEVTDTLPTGLAWTEDPDNLDCSISLAGVLTCDFGTMTAGATRTVHVVSPTDPADCGVVTNTANVGTSNDGSGSSTANVSINCPDIEIQKDGNGPINAGDTAVFTILVTNTGLGTAHNVVVTDTLPAGVAWGTGSTGCSIVGSDLTCTVGSLASGQSVTITVTGQTDSGDCAGLNNTAFVSASNAPGSSDGAVIPVNCPEIDIVKTADAAAVSAGSQIGFTILVTAGGNAPSNDVLVTDTLPAGFDWSEAPDNLDCSISLAGVLTCDFGTMAPGATNSVHVVASTDPADCGVVTNTAEVGTSNAGGGTSSDSVNIDCPDLTILKTEDQQTVNAGDQIGFSIVVTNNGPGEATTVTVTDTLPAGFSWTESPDNTDCTIAGQDLTCTFGTVAAGASETVHLIATSTAADCGIVTNTAHVSAGNDDPSSSTADLTVNCSNVVIAKTGNGTISAGDTAVFTIVVTNTGSGIARNVSVSDTLPAGIDWSENSTDCEINSGLLECSFGDVGPGATRSVTVSGITDADDCRTLENTALVSSSNESSTEDNSSSDTITVLCGAINISKTADSGSVIAGDPIGFTILITNGGDGRADNVTVTDTLPSNGGLTWAIDGGTGAADCSISGGVLTCNFGSMDSGATRTVHISSPTTAQSCGTVDNTGFVSTSNDGSDSDSDSITVTCPNLGIVIDKSVTPQQGIVGTPVLYTYVVTNTGEATLFNVTVTDDKLGPIGTIAQLLPGQSGTLTKASVLGSSGVINIGTAVGTDRLGRTVSDTDDAVVTVVAPLTLVRPPVPAPAPIAAQAPIAIAKTGIELWPPMLSAFLMILIGSACLRSGRLRPKGEYNWEFESSS